MKLTDRVREWQAQGRSERFRNHSIQVHQTDGEGPPLLLLHGFPSSSYDFRALLGALPGRRTLTFDFLGFGLSDKPRDHLYRLGWQADLVEEMVHRHFPGEQVFLIAHDMGTSVSTELFARDLEGKLGFAMTGAMLFNGSMILEKATLTRSQKLLRGRVGPLASKLSNYPVFRREFGAVFSPDHPLGADEAADQWSLVCHNGGRTLGHRLIHYLEERERLTERWHGAIRDWKASLSLTWGELDPVATVSVLEALIELRPGVPVERLPRLGHYPQVEDPAAIASAIGRAEARAVA